MKVLLESSRGNWTVQGPSSCPQPCPIHPRNTPSWNCHPSAASWAQKWDCFLEHEFIASSSLCHGWCLLTCDFRPSWRNSSRHATRKCHQPAAKSRAPRHRERRHGRETMGDWKNWRLEISPCNKNTSDPNMHVVTCFVSCSIHLSQHVWWLYLSIDCNAFQEAIGSQTWPTKRNMKEKTPAWLQWRNKDIMNHLIHQRIWGYMGDILK